MFTFGCYNHKRETLNEELRDHEKVMCGLKKDDSPIINSNFDRRAYRNRSNPLRFELKINANFNELCF